MIRRLFLALLLACFCAPAAADDAPATWYVPPGQFNAALQVMYLGFANVFALFPNATASFTFDESAKSIGHLRVALEDANLVTGNPETQAALATLLNAAQYPEIRITAPDSATFTDGKAALKATLTLHGVSKEVACDVVLNHVGKMPTGGGDAVGLSLRTSFKRADFAMGDDPEADQPARFGDTMTLMLEMQALRQ